MVRPKALCTLQAAKLDPYSFMRLIMHVMQCFQYSSHKSKAYYK